MNDPRVGMDYIFPCRCTVDASAKHMLTVNDAPAMVRKGENEYAIIVVAEALRFTGRARVIIFLVRPREAQQETGIVGACQPENDTVLHNTPVGSSASAGGIERANQEGAKQYRTLRSRTEEMCAIFGHGTTHFQIKADGRTPYEPLRNLVYHGELVDFAETVRHEDFAKDIGKFDDKWHVEIGLGWLLTSTTSAQVLASSAASEAGGAQRKKLWVPETRTSSCGRRGRPLKRSMCKESRRCASSTSRSTARPNMVVPRVFWHSLFLQLPRKWDSWMEEAVHKVVGACGTTVVRWM